MLIVQSSVTQERVWGSSYIAPCVALGSVTWLPENVRMLTKAFGVVRYASDSRKYRPSLAYRSLRGSTSLKHSAGPASQTSIRSCAWSWYQLGPYSAAAAALTEPRWPGTCASSLTTGRGITVFRTPGKNSR
jgi:hypothetical protein